MHPFAFQWATSLILQSQVTDACMLHVAACSWLQKMQVAKSVLIDEAPSNRPGLDELANTFIYLQASFLGHFLSRLHLHASVSAANRILCRSLNLCSHARKLMQIKIVISALLCRCGWPPSLQQAIALQCACMQPSICYFLTATLL